ncbi:tRNA(Met) cytidine acetyltransferase TmcA [Providencia rettgeri]|uniref:tRNA(Met) cytidine acetyltransferase TmcA n=1 Tax=Providencia rettgeri TaxID=587 RepID=UPI0034E0DEB0
MNDLLPAIAAQLRKCGLRRLLVLSGDDAWISQQLIQMQEVLSGDWLTISSDLPSGILPENAHLLLGREFLHGIFDARKGIHSEALAMQAGTLKAGSLLVFCTVPQEAWPNHPDIDSLRWNEQHGIISTPHFVHHLQRLMNASNDVIFYQQGKKASASLLDNNAVWQPPTGQLTDQQQHVLNKLLVGEEGVWGLIAPRGRGKSTVAGRLIRQWQGECWCCAPAKASTDVLGQHAGKPLHFWSPDALLAYCQAGNIISADWLIIDEAAAIPSYLLRQLIEYFPRVLLTTTVDGYEGTGRGFILKFCANLPRFTALTLDDPIRFATNDPLERWINQALLLQEPNPILTQHNTIEYQSISQSELATDESKLASFYGLLMSAHYRTSPLDLRRLLDAKNQHFMAAFSPQSHQHFLGALWMVDEGSLDKPLSWQIWAGLRRPRGNLVAQSLAAHSYFPQAAQWKSQRVMRIAVDTHYRRQQIGLTLLDKQKQSPDVQGLDFLSVSFGLTPDLLAFWQQAGFRLIRVGSQKEASSGCFTAMAILPMTVRAQQLCERGEILLQRDINMRTDLSEFALCSSDDQQLMQEDWLELIGFSEFKRPVSASQSAILRLLAHVPDSAPLLRNYFEQRHSLAQICEEFKLTGQKQWLSSARKQVGIWVKQYQPALLSEIVQKVTASYP